MTEVANGNTGSKQKPPFIFYVVLGSIPILFFILLELSLRIAGYGYEYKLFTKTEGAVPGMIYVNPEISYKYFGNITSPVFSSSVGLYEEKPKDGIRIFVLGGSSAQGYPYNQQASFPSHLKRRLDITYPEKTIEVINLGASAINTYTLLDILPEVLNQSPDLILIYAGHNEYYGALGAGSSRSISPALARTLLFLRDYRTVQLLENIIAGFSQKANDTNNNLMQDMIGQSFIELGSDTYLKGIQQFDSNLSLMLQMIKDAEVPVLIGTLASNIGDHKPFNASQISAEGLSANDYFKLGKESIGLSDSITAKINFTKAKEIDGLRFRAPEEINEVIKNKANQYNAQIVDIEAAFSRNSSMNIIGNELMCDHLHPNLGGYFLMSKEYFESILANGYLPKPKDPIENNGLDMDSLLLQEFPYTYLDTLVDRHLLLSGIGQYPFVPAGEPNPYQEILDNDGIYFNSSSINEIDSIRTVLAGKYLTGGNLNAFAREMNVFTSYFPYNELRYLHSINLLAKYGVLSEGYDLIFKRLVTLKDSYARTKALGLYYKHVERYDSALVYLEKVKKITPEDTYLLLDIGFIHLEMGNYDQAVEEFTKVITSSPNNQEAYHQRAVARFELKDYTGTIVDLDKSIKLMGAPDALSYLIRGYANLGINDLSSACEDWQLSAKLGSNDAKKLYQNYCGGKN